MAKSAEQLMTFCRIAKAQAQHNEMPTVFASKEVLDIWNKGTENPKCYITMAGCRVVEEGKLVEADQDFNLTMEQVNFG